MKFFRVCLLSAVITTGVTVNTTTKAGAVVGATEFTQIANMVQLGLSWYEQVQTAVDQATTAYKSVQQLENMRDRYKNMQLNTLLDGDKFFEDIYGDMQQLGRILQEGENLAYSTGNLDAAFRAKHKNFDEWAAINVPDHDPELVAGLARDWNQNSKDSVIAALEHTKFQYDDLADERQAINALKRQTDTVEGRMQALQAISSITLEQLQQTQKLRAAINNMTTLHANFYAQEAERKAVQEAFAKKRDDDTVAPARNTDTDNGRVLY